MKFTRNVIFAAGALSSTLVSATSLPTVGSTYFITNEPTGNNILVSNIGVNGKLSYSGVVSAGGVGGQGIQKSPASDPLFSQSAIAISGNLLAAVNAGSNTVALFSINPKNPSQLTMIGKPIPSGGEYPVSVGFNSKGTQLCVLNGGKVNGVLCFKVNQKSGLSAAVTPFVNLKANETTPPTGPPGSLSQVAFSADDSKLYASLKGVPPATGAFAVWDVNESGALSATYSLTPSTGSLPFSMNNIPGYDAFISTDATVGYQVAQFVNGELKVTGFPIAGQGTTCWAAYSPQIEHFYLSDPLKNQLFEVSLDKNLNGTLVLTHPGPPGAQYLDLSIATVSGIDFAYVLSPTSLTIEVLLLAGPGELINWQSFPFSVGTNASHIPINMLNVQGMAVYIQKPPSSPWWWW